MLALVFKFRFSFELTACQKNTDKAKMIAVMLPASLSWTDLTAVKILHRQDQMHLFFYLWEMYMHLQYNTEV